MGQSKITLVSLRKICSTVSFPSLFHTNETQFHISEIQFLTFDIQFRKTENRFHTIQNRFHINEYNFCQNEIQYHIIEIQFYKNEDEFYNIFYIKFVLIQAFELVSNKLHLNNILAINVFLYFIMYERRQI